MSSSLNRPRLRPGLAYLEDENDPHYVFVYDRLRLASGVQRLTIVEAAWMQLFDGEKTLRDIQAEAINELNGAKIPLELFTSLVEKLDEALFLDSPRFQARLRGPVREPSCLGCYEADPKALDEQIRGFFSRQDGPGLPEAKSPDGQLRAALLPHIDYQRGGVSYAWGFKEVFERTDASLFVIVGTSHYSLHRFTLTRKDFKTPLGIAETDQDFIARLVGNYGDGLFDDEIAHLPEHSIELEVVFLQWFYARKKRIRIVPLLVGSFQDCVLSHTSPRDHDDIGRMIQALRKTEAEAKENICYIISGDLAHLGPKFGDARLVEDRQLTQSLHEDRALIKEAEQVNTDSYFRLIAKEADSRRICGLPPTYTVLEASRPRSGKSMHYGRYIHPQGYESVSFASMCFYR